jgi:hypothetical protein
MSDQSKSLKPTCDYLVRKHLTRIGYSTAQMVFQSHALFHILDELSHLTTYKYLFNHVAECYG